MTRYMHRWSLLDVGEAVVALVLALVPPWLYPDFREPVVFFLPVMHLIQVALHISRSHARHWWLTFTFLLDAMATARVVAQHLDLLLDPPAATATVATTTSLGQFLALLVPLLLVNGLRFLFMQDEQDEGDGPAGPHPPAKPAHGLDVLGRYQPDERERRNPLTANNWRAY
jgi:hypothetical protein